MQDPINDKFLQWWNLYSPELIQFVYWRVGSDVSVDDVVADSFYKLFTTQHLYLSDDHAKRSLYVIARNCIIDLSRKSKHNLSGLIWDWWNSVPDTDIGITKKISNEEVLVDIQKALSTLSELERDCVLMKYSEGQDYKYIANCIQKSEPATRKLTNRAIIKMRELLENIL